VQLKVYDIQMSRSSNIHIKFLHGRRYTDMPQIQYYSKIKK